ncbi:hypothetical protein J1605_018629 [Eschrichtius robustus]|uniref:Uncharacterized protein n=1 Tax=Eschrichtius robustus TaxID=9764 RepID=A0AB34HTL8_ESCRO|nr:hypothetical protein J1605_018629 [Eschrichtius robustus]
MVLCVCLCVSVCSKAASCRGPSRECGEDDQYGAENFRRISRSLSGTVVSEREEVPVSSHSFDSSNARKKPLETGHRCSSSSSLPVIHDPPVFLLGPQLYPSQPQFLSPDVLMPSVAGEPHRPPGVRLLVSVSPFLFLPGLSKAAQRPRLASCTATAARLACRGGPRGSETFSHAGPGDEQSEITSALAHVCSPVTAVCPIRA